MPIEEYDTIKRHSTFPYLSFEFFNEDDERIDCSLYEVKLIVKNRHDITVIEKIVGASGSPAVWIDESQGIGEYRWQAGDTDVAGKYAYEFRLKRLYDNRPFKIPENDFLYYIVKTDIPEASGVV